MRNDQVVDVVRASSLLTRGGGGTGTSMGI